MDKKGKKKKEIAASIVQFRFVAGKKGKIYSPQLRGFGDTRIERTTYVYSYLSRTRPRKKKEIYFGKQTFKFMTKANIYV